MIIKTIHSQKALSPTQISLADFVVNPYRGCEFGCLYCYAQQNQNTRSNFFDTVGIKINLAEVLEKELRFTKPKRVLLGSTTECFQYQEENFKITQQILTILDHRGIPYTILTKSHLIEKYLPLIAGNKENKIYFTLNCAHEPFLRLLEPRSSSLACRLQAIQAIIRSDISLRIHIGPFIPYICDLEQVLNILPSGVKEVDVELYHHAMGNIDALVAAFSNIDQACGRKLSSVYKDAKGYRSFADDLHKRLLEAKSRFKYSFYYIVPDYDEFYRPDIDYCQTI